MKSTNSNHLIELQKENNNEIMSACNSIKEKIKKLSELNNPYNADVDDVLTELHFDVENIREQIG